MTIYKLAYIKDPVDNRDQLFSAVANKLNAAAVSYSNEYRIPEYTPISNQYETSSCVGNATCDALEVLQGIKNPNNVKQLSRLFVYYNARVKINAAKQDGGCIIRDAFTTLNKIGVCEESLWDFDINKVLLHPPLEAYKSANDNKITGFYRIAGDTTTRCDYIEQAIRANHPVVFGSLLSPEFMNCFNKSTEPVFDKPSTTHGGHAQLITGVRYVNGKRQFLVRNSWSEDFGYNGHSFYTEEYIGSDLCSDFWCASIIEDLI